MYFLRKRREKRDQEAGLVFRWRGAKAHHVGKLIALMIAASFFAFSVYAIRIDVGQELPLSKRTGSVFMINEEDPHSYHLLVQIEERSPFPRRWDPAYDEDTMRRVSEEANLLAGYVREYKPELRPLPVADEIGALPSVIKPASALTGNAVKAWMLESSSGESTRGDVYVQARITADEKIEKRLQGKTLSLPRVLVAEEWYGQTYRFHISVNAKGVVTDCLPLSGESLEVMKPMEKEKLLAAWLRSQRLESAADAAELRGVIELEIEALREND